MSMLIRRSLVVVVLIMFLSLPGCNAYMLQGKVVRGGVSDVQLVYAGDERLNAPGAENVEVRISRDADTLNRHLVGRTRTDATGVFTIVMDEFGTGWMQEKWLIEAIGPGFQNAALDMELPSKNTKWRLLITLAPGVSQPVQDEDLMQDIERFK